eukprot:scaffold26118_cov29-Tisochrysis_lutea.AAC.5
MRRTGNTACPEGRYSQVPYHISIPSALGGWMLKRKYGGSTDVQTDNMTTVAHVKHPTSSKKLRAGTFTAPQLCRQSREGDRDTEKVQPYLRLARLVELGVSPSLAHWHAEVGVLVIVISRESEASGKSEQQAEGHDANEGKLAGLDVHV